jgi:hypothetical protein
MIHLSISAAVLCLALGQAAPGSLPSEADTKAIQKTQQLLAENRLSLAATETTLGKLLETLEKQLPEGKKVSLRIDKEVFGKDAAKIVEAPVRLPKLEGVALGTILQLARSQVSAKTDYRLEDGAFVITTPARALYTASHDIRDLVEDPGFDPGSVGLGLGVRQRDPVPGRQLDPADKAAGIARLICTVVATPESWYSSTEAHGTIQILNGTRLVIHANASRHAEVAELLDALRRLSDIRVALDARLYSVDRDTYTKVKTARRLSRAELEELEEQVEKRGEGSEALGKPLAKQKLTATGETRIANGLEAVFLSQHKVVSSPPILRGDKLPAGLAGNAQLTEPQVALEGVSFAARVVVSADRRFVHLKVTEKATEIDELPKVQLPKKPDGKAPPQDVQDQVADLLAALRRAGPLEPVLSESAHKHEVDIPDGGSRTIAVRVRPRALEAAERWWLLVITPRIIIKEEERALLEQSLKNSLPALVTDLLTNPRLKTTRAFYGSPDDRRYALVQSERWAWPEPTTVSDFQLNSATRKGKRLLGIRIDDFQFAGKDQDELVITVSLLNAGGSDNGAVPGSGRLRYTARLKEKKWQIELAAPDRE